MNENQAIAIIREELPGIGDDEAGAILWNHTGWPCFFRSEDVAGEIRRSVREAKENGFKEDGAP